MSSAIDVYVASTYVVIVGKNVSEQSEAIESLRCWDKTQISLIIDFS